MALIELPVVWRRPEKFVVNFRRLLAHQTPFEDAVNDKKRWSNLAKVQSGKAESTIRGIWDSLDPSTSSSLSGVRLDGPAGVID